MPPAFDTEPAVYRRPPETLRDASRGPSGEAGEAGG